MNNTKLYIFYLLYEIKKAKKHAISSIKWMFFNIKYTFLYLSHIATIIATLTAIISLYLNYDSLKLLLNIENLKKEKESLEKKMNSIEDKIAISDAIMVYYDNELNSKRIDVIHKLQRIETLKKEIKQYELSKSKLKSENIHLKKENLELNNNIKDLEIKLFTNDNKYKDMIYKKEKYIYLSVLLVNSVMDFYGTIMNISEFARHGDEKKLFMEINNIESVYQIIKNNIYKLKNNPELIDTIPNKSTISISLFFEKKIETIHTLKNLSIHSDIKYFFIQLFEDLKKIAEEDSRKYGIDNTYRVMQKANEYIDEAVKTRLYPIIHNHKNNINIIIDQLYNDDI